MQRTLGDRPAGNASLAVVRWCSLTGRAQAVTRKHCTVAITQYSKGWQILDFAVSMPRTPLNFPHVRQMKLLLYFATLQVTETQLLLLLTQFHPPEFKWLWCLSELPCLFSLLYPRGKPARASQLPLLSRTHLSECFSSPWKTSVLVSRAPMLRLLMQNWPAAPPRSGLFEYVTLSF